MSKYRVLHRDYPFVIEAEEVAFNLDYNMTFFKNGEEVIAAVKMDIPFHKMKEEETKTDDD